MLCSIPSGFRTSGGNPEKKELESAILASAKVVVDVLEQCAAIGELHHALDARLMQRADVHAELAEVVAGSKPGRASDEEVVIFDSTGTALQDVAAALAVHDKAVRSGTGEAIDRIAGISSGDQRCALLHVARRYDPGWRDPE